MKQLAFILVVLMSCHDLAFAQQDEIDSLEFVLKNQELHDTNRINILNDIARLLDKDSEKKEQYLLEGKKIAERISDNRRLTILTLNLTRYYLNNGDFALAHENALQSIEIGKLLDDPSFAVEGYNNLALVYTNQHKDDEALEIYIEGYEYIKEQPSSMDKAILSFNIAFSYYQKGDYALAEKWFLEVLAICEEIQLDFGILRAYGGLLDVYGKTKEFEKGDLYKEKGLKLIQNIDDYRSIGVFYMNLTVYAQDKGDQDEVIKYGLLAEEFFIELNMKSELISVYDKIFKAFNLKESYKSAYDYSLKRLTLSDSLYSEQQIKAIEEMETKYETAKITQEKEQAETNEAFAKKLAVKNRNLFIASILGGSALLLLALFFIYQQQLRKRAELAEVKLTESENKLKLERKINDAEMKALKSQMNPHFLFNAFNSIQEFIILNNRELASDYLGKFADLMRLYLDHSREKSISLENEISTTSLYLELEKIRFEDTLNYAVNVAENIDTAMVQIPPMLVQPFIENSLKHGLLHKKEDRQLKVDFYLENQTLVCAIEDNGIGREKSAMLNKNKLKKHKSFATSATQNRIELLNIGREKDITLRIIDLKDDDNLALGTRVEIKIPLD